MMRNALGLATAIGFVFGIALGNPGARAAEVVLPFDLTKDALCFRNGDPDLAKTGVPILGSLGARKGVCQGIAGIAAAFRENVEFVPNADRDSPTAVSRRLDRAIAANRAGSRGKIAIRGYASLFDLCRANRMTFLRKSIWVNAEIGVSEIFLPHYGAFLRLKKDPIGSKSDALSLRRELRDHLADARAELREGKYPLLLYYSHVVLVRGYRDIAEASGKRIDLEVYDSNHPEALRTISVPIAADGLPSGENPMYWVL